MEQRRLRLGDILDDYCPRERRVTNHAVVAMIEEDVKQTRCTTCDAEHPYKGGHAPRRKRKEAGPSSLYKEVLAGKSPVGSPSAAAASAVSHEDQEDADADSVDGVDPQFESTEMASDDQFDDTRDDDHVDVSDDDAQPGIPDVEDGPVHRPLIRATLPRPEGQKDVRTPPDFTIRQTGGRGGNHAGNAPFRGGGGGGGGNANRMRSRSGAGGNGSRPHGPSRFANARSGQGQNRGGGHGGGNFRPQQQQPRHGGGGRKRSR
jgi:hypothetical protein